MVFAPTMFESGAIEAGGARTPSRFSPRVLARLFTAVQRDVSAADARRTADALLLLIAHHPAAHQALADLRQMARDAGVDCSAEIGTWALDVIAAHDALDHLTAAAKASPRPSDAAGTDIGIETLRRIATARRRRGDPAVTSTVLRSLGLEASEHPAACSAAT